MSAWTTRSWPACGWSWPSGRRWPSCSAPAGRPSTSAPTSCGARGSPYIERFGIRSYVAVRLGTAARPLGVLFVNHTRRHRFTRPELAFVETLTSYLSVTIERARLVSVLREAVTSLQAAVLPADFPALPGLEVAALYRSASEVAQVGGDFYDLFALEDGRVAAVIGDVCGKGVAAARHTVRIRYELRTLLEDGRPPGRVLTEFNRRVQEEFVSDEYATLLLVVLDSSTGVASWSSAGHPPPLLTGATPRTLAFGGSLPVGLFADATYQTARFTLAAGPLPGPLHRRGGRGPQPRRPAVRHRGAGGGRPGGRGQRRRRRRGRPQAGPQPLRQPPRRRRRRGGGGGALVLRRLPQPGATGTSSPATRSSSRPDRRSGARRAWTARSGSAGWSAGLATRRWPAGGTRPRPPGCWPARR